MDISVVDRTPVWRRVAFVVVLLGWLFLWGKRSLTPVILGHSLAVLISEPFATMMIFMAPGL